jgi:hypothetical protein
VTLKSKINQIVSELTVQGFKNVKAYPLAELIEFDSRDLKACQLNILQVLSVRYQGLEVSIDGDGLGTVWVDGLAA